MHHIWIGRSGKVLRNLEANSDHRISRGFLVFKNALKSESFEVSKTAGKKYARFRIEKYKFTSSSANRCKNCSVYLTAFGYSCCGPSTSLDEPKNIGFDKMTVCDWTIVSFRMIAKKFSPVIGLILFVNVLSSKVLYDFGWGIATPAFAKVSLLRNKVFRRRSSSVHCTPAWRIMRMAKAFKKKSADIL